ncbi:nucleolar protein dao-5 [Patella vulgata]|uniref:nucleolar protein dao-5 n=1 Tax=Patella vulgata TaxID=6465 RepID=UPI0021808117|nr:nucleolar protein dao-5 [Patella vulgata]
MENNIKIIIFVFLADIHTVLCQDVEISNDVSKAFITIAVLVAILIISFVVAKIFDYCYDHSTLRDDDSNISEDTRKKIRDRLLGAGAKAKKKEVKNKILAVHRASLVIRHLSEMATKRRASQQAYEIDEENEDPASGQKKGAAKVTFVDEDQKSLASNSKTLQVPGKGALKHISNGNSKVSPAEITPTKKQPSESNQKSKVTPNNKPVQKPPVISAPSSANKTSNVAPSTKAKNGIKAEQTVESQNKVPVEIGSDVKTPPKILIKRPTEADLVQNLQNDQSTKSKTETDPVTKPSNSLSPTGDTKPSNIQLSVSSPKQSEKTRRTGQMNSQSAPSKSTPAGVHKKLEKNAQKSNAKKNKQ